MRDVHLLTTDDRRLTTLIQLCRFQKIVVAGRIQREIAYSLRVHQNVVEIPEIDVGQFVGQGALDFRVELLAGVLVEFVAGLVDQRIHPRIGEVSAVGAVGRELGGVENIFEDVGIFVAADPAQGIELEEAVGHVGKESREFEGANIERDSHLPQLLLQHRRHQPRAFFGGRLHGEMKANAVHLGISSLLEQLAGAGGIVVVGGHVAVVGPALRGQNAIGGPGKTALQIFEQRAAVDGIGQGLPHALVFENGIAQVERQVGQHRAGGVQDGEIRIALQSQHHVGGQSVDGDVGAALAQFESARGGVGHDDKADILERCAFSPQ